MRGKPAAAELTGPGGHSAGSGDITTPSRVSMKGISVESWSGAAPVSSPWTIAGPESRSSAGRVTWRGGDGASANICVPQGDDGRRVAPVST